MKMSGLDTTWPHGMHRPVILFNASISSNLEIAPASSSSDSVRQVALTGHVQILDYPMQSLTFRTSGLLICSK